MASTHGVIETPCTQVEAAYERDEAWAEVLTEHISHRMLSMTL
jgi:hypothetical protein